MNQDLFFGCYQDHETFYIEHWAESVKINYVKSYDQYLECRNKVLIMKAIDANYRIDLVRQLLKHNYIVLLDVRESGAAPDSYYFDLVRDCPELQSAPLIVAGENQVPNSANLETFFFKGLSDINILKSEQALEKIYQPGHKPYRFLYLNGADRPHRAQLWKQLDQLGVLGQSLRSYLGYSNQPDQISDIPKATIDPYYECPWIDSGVTQLDIKDYNTFCLNFFRIGFTEGYIVPNQYADTYFTVVTESITEVDARFVSEKTYKPLLAGHPLIVLSTPGHLAYLKQLGFKTWSPFIDESYDEEPDLTRRINMVSDEIHRLCHVDPDQFLIQCQEIGQYNHWHYRNYRSALVREVQQRLKNFFGRVINDAAQYFADKESSNV